MSSTLKFVDSIPEGQRAPGKTARLIEQLAQRPGEWAEVERDYVQNRARIAMKGSYMKKADPRVEAVTRTVGGQTILFARVIDAA